MSWSRDMWGGGSGRRWREVVRVGVIKTHNMKFSKVKEYCFFKRITCFTVSFTKQKTFRGFLV